MSVAVKRPGRDRQIFSLLRALSGKTPTQIARMAAKRGYKIAPTTIAKWRISPTKGGTKFPQHYTMMAAAKAVGMEFALVPEATAETKPARREQGYLQQLQ